MRRRVCGFPGEDSSAGSALRSCGHPLSLSCIDVDATLVAEPHRGTRSVPPRVAAWTPLVVVALVEKKEGRRQDAVNGGRDGGQVDADCVEQRSACGHVSKSHERTAYGSPSTAMATWTSLLACIGWKTSRMPRLLAEPWRWAKSSSSTCDTCQGAPASPSSPCQLRL